MREFLRNYGFHGVPQIAWKALVDGELGGQAGPVFLAAPLALASLATRPGRRLLFAGLVFLLPYPQNVGTRFLIPALPFVALAMAAGMERLWPRVLAPAAVVGACVLSWPGVIALYEMPSNWRIQEIPVRAALGLVPADQWLLERSPSWVIARMLDQFVPPGQKIWSTMPVAEAYAKSEVLVNYFSAEGELLEDILLMPLRPETQPLREWRYSLATPSNRLRLELKAGGAGMWSIGEMRFYSAAGVQLKPRHVSASTFPWDIGLAVDDNPATRWRTWETARPGMWVEAEFAEPVQRAEVFVSADQNTQASLAGGATESLQVSISDQARPQAVEAMAARGIRYLLLGDGYFAASDIRANPARWGLELVADRGSARLYRIATYSGRNRAAAHTMAIDEREHRQTAQ
jgi:hypothetical protein